MLSELAVGFDDLTVLSEGDSDIFVINLNEDDAPPPYYITVNERRFSFTGETFLIFGHSATLSNWAQEQETLGLLPLLAERDDRYLRYTHNPASALEEENNDEE